MFVFGFLLGLAVAAGVVWLLRFDGGQSLANELVIRRARRQIHDLERATIHRMLNEAEEARRNRGSCVEILDSEDKRP